MATTEVVTFAFYYELIGGIFLVIISILLFGRYFDRKRNATLYLSLAVLSLGIGVIVTGLGRLFALFEGITAAYHGYQYTPFVWIALALTLNVVGDIFFLLFINDVFYESNKKFAVFVIILGGILALLQGILIPTPVIVPATSEPVQLYIDMFQVIWLGHALFTFATGGIVIYSTLKFSRKDRPLVEKRGLQLISVLGFGLALTNIMFIIDEFMTPYFGGNFSIFYYLAWVCAYVGIIFAYLGFVLPNWLRKRWE